MLKEAKAEVSYRYLSLMPFVVYCHFASQEAQSATANTCAIQHVTVFECPLGHRTSVAAKPVLLLHIRDDDIQWIAKRVKQQHPTIGDYLNHFVPRETTDQLAEREHDGPDLRRSTLDACHECSSNATVVKEVRTRWPQMLAVLPTTSSMLKSELPKILATGNLIHPTLNVSIHSQNVPDTTSSSAVTYRLIGRVLYKIAQQSKSQSSHHWTAQFLIGDQTFLYDDCWDQGIMKAIGEPSILETQSYLASMWIYHRVTENAVRIVSYYLRKYGKP